MAIQVCKVFVLVYQRVPSSQPMAIYEFPAAHDAEVFLTNDSPIFFLSICPLRIEPDIAIEHGHRKIVDLPIKNGGGFHSKTVSLPEDLYIIYNRLVQGFNTASHVLELHLS